MRPLAALACSLLIALPGLARAASAEELGAIAAELDAGEKALKASAGDEKKLTRAQLQELEKKLDQNRKAVLQKHRVTERDYSKQSIKLGRGGLEVKEAARKTRTAELAAEAEKAKKKPAAKGGVEVVRGFDAKRPVVVDEVETGDTNEIPIERGGDTDQGDGVTLYESEAPPERADESTDSPSEPTASGSEE